MRLRRAEAADVAGIVGLEAAVFGGDAWSEAQVRAELTAPTHVVVVAEQDGVVSGYGCIAEAGEVADLLRIAVVSVARRIGIASSLLKALVGEVRVADRMMLEVSASNAGAQGFYAARGFSEISRRRNYFANGDDALILSAPLR